MPARYFFEIDLIFIVNLMGENLLNPFTQNIGNTYYMCTS